MKREYAFQTAPCCTATSKRTGNPCQAPAVRGWSVCRFHGAGGGGPQGRTQRHVPRWLLYCRGHCRAAGRVRTVETMPGDDGEDLSVKSGLAALCVGVLYTFAQCCG